MLDKYHRDGTPYPEGSAGVLEWSKDLERGNCVKKDILSNGKVVSTVWLGLDHSFEGDHACPGCRSTSLPLIFETMVFPDTHNWEELDMERYSTEEQALKGHEMMVKKWS